MAEGRRQFKVGRVVSDKMEKTVVVAVDYLKPHPLYPFALKGDPASPPGQTHQDRLR